MDIQGYVNEIRALHASGQSTEHSFRPALAKLFGSIDPALTVINEPKHLTDVGAPDFVFNRGDVAIGWCEAKDIGKDVRKFAATDYSKAQKERYKKGLPNLIYTNGLDFEFIRDGESVDFISIADAVPNLPAHPANFTALENRLRDFAHVTPLSVTSSAKLAAMMAGKAAIIKDIMGRALVADMKARDATGTATDLIGQFEAFKTSLIHDITVEEFADIYAETIAYGLFAARLHDETPDTFTRAEALDLLPKTNPFLRELFIYIAGPNLDERLRRVIDELCHVFCATDMDKVLRNFGKITARQDPFLHFYEDFLAEYNPAKRKARGVWYTPEPVVNFIVRAVDDVLKASFGLADGLADTSKITIDWDTGQNHPKTGKPAHIKKEVHRVQILDPATGTGTFLAEVVKLASERIRGVAPGQLSAYIERDLIPRLHGFELLMASYAMCHMKLDMILTRLGYKPSATPPRLGVYLTNSLEEGERAEQTLFGLSRAIANEAKAASDVKRQTPIMCVIGNPPYNSSSANNGPWIDGLIAPYKAELGEQKVNLNDDYIKFLRLGESYIERNGQGILAMITNNSFLDGITQRHMRRHLRRTFDTIYVLNLHGDIRMDSGSTDKDENVFDITQGVAISIFVKKEASEKGKLGQVYYANAHGSRKSKYDRLFIESLSSADFSEIDAEEPNYRFLPSGDPSREAYDAGFPLNALALTYSSGVQTKRDSICVTHTRGELEQILSDFSMSPASELRERYGLPKDGRDWTINSAKEDVACGNGQIHEFTYKPFDTRYFYYSGKTKGFVAYPRRDVMQHIVGRENISLLFNRQNVRDYFSYAGVTQFACNHGTFYLGNRGQDYCFPLYLRPDEGTLDQTIRVNFDAKLYAQIRKAAGLTGTSAAPDGTDAFRKATSDARPDEVKVFDYIYGVLHCPAYRARYAEFLKIDFPRIPFPPSPNVFHTISEQGEALRRLHLMEAPAIGETPYPFHGDGDSMVDNPRYENGQVWINAGQYFDGVPAISWDFPIGGYQPAQKWLKDRKGRALTYDDIRHYQRIIKILAETDRIMRTIEMPLD